jgi:hypothetical protein
VFHVELRRFPHVARAFNLTEEELQARIVVPWAKGAPVELQDRRFTRDRARLTVYEAPELGADDRGLGRGWSIVQRGADVTARVLEAAEQLVPRASELKRAVVAASEPVPLSKVVALAGGWGRPSERLGVAEQAVWELLHEGRVALRRSGADVPRDEWESLLLHWDAWADPAIELVVLGPPAPE